VNVWSVEYEQFEDSAAVEDFQDPEAVSAAGRRQVLAAFPIDPITTCISITSYLLIALH
jgi:hypothetical protein